MFKKYTALAAAMMLASNAAMAAADCTWQDCNSTFALECHANQGIHPTPWSFCPTCGCADTTCGHICSTCRDCGATCGELCSSLPMPEATAIPLPVPTVQPTQKPAATQAPSTGDDYTTQSVSAQEQKMANLLNQDRNSYVLGALPLDAELCRIARIKSADMRDNGYFAHESPTYGNVGNMLQHFGYRYASAGENIAHHANVDKAQAAFMSSQGHRQNILGNWTRMGIGIVTDDNGYIYATQIFAK